MKRVLILALAVALASMATIERASAQRIELGARAGISSQNLDMKFDGLNDMKAKVGWHLAAVSRIKLVGFGGDVLGAGLFLQPEIVFTQSNLRMNGQIRHTPDEIEEYGSKLRMQSIDIPVLLSLKVSIVRLQVGPVFNVMNKYSTLSGTEVLVPVSRPVVGYGLGLSVDIIGGLVIDGRYQGEFGKLRNAVNAGEGLRPSVKGSLTSWSVGLSWLF